MQKVSKKHFSHLYVFQVGDAIPSVDLFEGAPDKKVVSFNVSSNVLKALKQTLLF